MSAAGNLTGSRDANSNLTQYLYDALNRQTVTIDALSNRTTSFFDAGGNLTGLVQLLTGTRDAADPGPSP